MRTSKYGWALVYLLCGVVAVLALMTLSSIRQGQKERAPLIEQTNIAADEARHATHQIVDCTTPGRACYERAQRQQAAAIAALTQGNQRAASAAAACAAQLDHPAYTAIYRCVLHTLTPRR